MQITYNVTLNDLIEFSLFHYFKQSPEYKRELQTAKVTSTFFFIVLLFLVTLLLDQQHFLRAYIISIIFGALFYSVYSNWYVKGVRKNLVKVLNEGNNDSVIGQQTTVISPETLVNICPSGESKIYWKYVSNIVETSGYIYIYLTSVSAIIIPNSGFENAEVRNSFYELAQRYYHDAKSQIGDGAENQKANLAVNVNKNLPAKYTPEQKRQLTRARFIYTVLIMCIGVLVSYTFLYTLGGQWVLLCLLVSVVIGVIFFLSFPRLYDLGLGRRLK